MLSKRVGALKPSPTIAITSKVRELKSRGVDVIGFGAGEPDIDTPEFIKEACIRALREGKTKYPPAGGIPELREAIARKLYEENGIEYRPSEVVVTVGAKLAIYLVLSTVIDEGDEVLLPTPYWVTYEDQIRLCGGVPVPVPMSMEDKFSLRFEAVAQRASTRTKLIIINSPTNPTGMVFERREIERIAEFCVERGIYILSDECYESLIYEDSDFFSIASLSEEVKKITFTVNSFSKTYSMTGWRVGYVACDEELSKTLLSINSHLVSNTPTFAQYGALEALKNPEGKEFIGSTLELYRRRRDVIYEGLSSLPNVKVLKPQATFFIFPDFSHYTSRVGGDVRFAQLLLEKSNVAVVPGSAFGAEGFLRFSFAIDEESIREGIERIGNALKSF